MSRIAFSAALLAAAGLASVAVVTPPPAFAEDTCFDRAPNDTAAIRGITWSGTVVAIRKTSVDAYGVESWRISFLVDHVFARDPQRDFPKGAVLAAGQRFDLPNQTCTGHGDLGLIVGNRYLVSTAFVNDGGTDITGLAIWKLDGEKASIVPGLYGTAHAGADIAGVATVGDILALLGIAPEQPSSTPFAATPTPPPTMPTDDVHGSPPWPGYAALVMVGLGAAALLWRRRRVTLADAD